MSQVISDLETSMYTEAVYNCGWWWDEVVYSVGVVGDSRKQQETAVDQLSYVDWRIQAYVGYQETAVHAV